MEYIALFVATLTVNNFVLAKYLGLCPFIGVSKKLDSAIGMGLAVTFVMTLASFATYLIYMFVLVPLDIKYLDTITFILVIASLVQLVEMILEKFTPHLYKALGVYLPLITTNCAILGVAQFNVQYIEDPQYSFGFIKCILHGFAGGIGFTVALVLMAGIRERLEFANIPEVFKGAAVTFIAAGLMALAFQGFANLVSITVK
ncbi:MAG: electron transport complex subunit RsxA [Spirochaetota bacterium]|nr:electron transport complex subunit RsxA [Spirochaetota bacterium]